MESKGIYTCLTGAYDALPQPLVTSGDWRFVCFTDNPSADGGVWEMRPIPRQDTPAAASRLPKLLPHEFLQDFEVSLYIDSNIRITGEAFYSAALAAASSGALWAGVPHPGRDCVYEENLSCYLSGLSRWGDAFRLKRRLQQEGFPRHAGLLENNLILRRHLAPEVMETDKLWWDAYRNGIRRDQLHLMPLLAKAGIEPLALLPEGRNARSFDSLEVLPHSRPAPSPHPRPRIVKSILKNTLK